MELDPQPPASGDGHDTRDLEQLERGVETPVAGDVVVGCRP